MLFIFKNEIEKVLEEFKNTSEILNHFLKYLETLEIGYIKIKSFH